MATYPTKYKQAFASQGQYNVIPDEPKQKGEGYANFQEGCPPELSKPFSESGKAVQRLDFNGILNKITAFQMYQQAGGMFKYDPSENYNPPAIVYDEISKEFYQCLRANGPDTGYNQVPSQDTAEQFWRQLVGGKQISAIQEAVDTKMDKNAKIPTAQVTGLSKYIDDKCTVGAQTFTRSASRSGVEFTISATRDNYGRLTGLSMSATNCTDTDTDVDTDVDYDSDADTDAY